MELGLKIGRSNDTPYNLKFWFWANSDFYVVEL
jgi:hypothetical protein